VEEATALHGHNEALISRALAAPDEVSAGQFQRMTAKELITELAEATRLAQ
jgi:hypothetical protein